MTGILTIDKTSSTTKNVTDVLILKSQSSGTAANGIGSGIRFVIDTNGGYSGVCRIESVTTDVSPRSEDVDLVFYTMSSGISSESLRIIGSNLKIAGDLMITGGNIVNAIWKDGKEIQEDTNSSKKGD